MSKSPVRAVFTCSAALLAAAAGDALLEGVSNAGILWRGNYTDRSSLDLVPVLLLAALAVVVTLALSVYLHMRETGVSTRSFILASARSLDERSVVRLLPAIFVLQLAVLFGMETAEQIAVYGHVLGGALWMGAPVAASLLGHAFFSVVSALALSKGLEAATKALVRIVKCMLTLLAAFVDARPRPRLRPERICAVQCFASAVAGERGPPLFIA